MLKSFKQWPKQLWNVPMVDWLNLYRTLSSLSRPQGSLHLQTFTLYIHTLIVFSCIVATAAHWQRWDDHRFMGVLQQQDAQNLYRYIAATCIWNIILQKQKWDNCTTNTLPISYLHHTCVTFSSFKLIYTHVYYVIVPSMYTINISRLFLFSKYP